MKADVVGMLALQWLMNRGVLPRERLAEYYASYVAGIFRTADSAEGLFDAIGMPRDRRPAMFDRPSDTWRRIFADLLPNAELIAFADQDELFGRIPQLVARISSFIAGTG